MPRSLSDKEVKAVLEDARTGRAKMHPSPEDWRDQVIYEIMVDRFNNPEAEPRYDWAKPYGSFQGGSYAGVEAKLPYLKKMGVTALWLTPVLKNCPWDDDTYHGYGIQNFLAAEPRFAADPERADDELRALVDAAHEHGIYVIFDIVLHHAGNVFAYADGGENGPLRYASDHGWSDQPLTVRWRDERGEPRPEWEEIPADAHPGAGIMPVELRRNELFLRQGTYDNDERPQADFYALKSFNTELIEGGKDRRPLYDLLTRAYEYVIARFDVDGFRIDTLKFVTRDFEAYFSEHIRAFARGIGKKNFFLFGEVWADERTISAFLARGGDPRGKLIGVDAVQDYPLYSVLPQVLKGMERSPCDLARLFEERKEIEAANLKLPRDAGKRYVTFLDNHDVSSRFGYTGDAQDIAQIVAGLACLICIPGVPSIYYGTEQGLQGHKSPENQDDANVREALWGKPEAFDESGPIYKAVSELTRIRGSEPALTRGMLHMRPVSGDGSHFAVSSNSPGVLVFSRLIESEEIVFAVNLNPVDGFRGFAIVDGDLSHEGSTFDVLYSSRRQKSKVPQSVAELRRQDDVTVQEVDGRETHGPAIILPLNLQPLEAVILKRQAHR